MNKVICMFCGNINTIEDDFCILCRKRLNKNKWKKPLLKKLEKNKNGKRKTN